MATPGGAGDGSTIRVNVRTMEPAQYTLNVSPQVLYARSLQGGVSQRSLLMQSCMVCSIDYNRSNEARAAFARWRRGCFKNAHHLSRTPSNRQLYSPKQWWVECCFCLCKNTRFSEHGSCMGQEDDPWPVRAWSCC